MTNCTPVKGSIGKDKLMRFYGGIKPKPSDTIRQQSNSSVDGPVKTDPIKKEKLFRFYNVSSKRVDLNPDHDTATNSIAFNPTPPVRANSEGNNKTSSSNDDEKLLRFYGQMPLAQHRSESFRHAKTSRHLKADDRNDEEANASGLTGLMGFRRSNPGSQPAKTAEKGMSFKKKMLKAASSNF